MIEAFPAVAVGLAGAWALAAVGLGAASYVGLFHPRRVSVADAVAQGLAAGDFTPDIAGAPWERHRIASPRGYALAAIALAGRGSAPTLVFVHGIRMNRASAFKYALPFRERGWNVVAFDLPGHGDSRAPRRVHPGFGFTEKDDLAAVVAWAEARFGGPVVLAGESMGAATLLQYLPQASPAVKAAIADCSYSSLPAELDARLAAWLVPGFLRGPAIAVASGLARVLRGYPLAVASPLAAVAASSVPVLFVHGGDDSYVPVRMSAELAEARGAAGTGPAELVVVPGARHAKSVLVDPDAWFAAAFAFLGRWVGSGPA